MLYIPLEKHLPGITGLLEYSKDTAADILPGEENTSAKVKQDLTTAPVSN